MVTRLGLCFALLFRVLVRTKSLSFACFKNGTACKWLKELGCNGRPSAGNKDAGCRSAEDARASGEACQVAAFAWEKKSRRLVTGEQSLWEKPSRA